MSKRKRPEIVWLTLSAVGLVLSAQAYAGGSISGVAFRDYNANGVQDLLEPGIHGLQVSATDELGHIETTTTTSDGTYSTVALAGNKARVEFTLPADGSFNFLKPAASTASSVQFVDISTNDATNISVGFNNPAQYCNANPQLATPCYVHGPAEGNTLDALVGFDYNASGANGDNDQSISHYATTESIGATYGLAYQRSSKTLYASAFMKRHSGFGPGGTGAIYSIDPSGTHPPSVFVDLNTEFGEGTAGIDPHPFGHTEICSGQFEAGETNGNCWFHDSETWTEVGRSSLGDLDISDDESELYVINLQDKSLYTIPTSAPEGQVEKYELPLGASDQPECQFTDADNDNRNDSVVPFATKFHDGELYVGAICTELGTTAPFQDLNFPVYVYTFDPIGHTWEQVFTSGIQRQTTTFDTNFHETTWLRWLPDLNNNFEDQRKPLLTDIEFDGNDMILGIRDMYADMVGNARGNVDPNVPGEHSTVPTGDLLRACFDDASNTWIMENNGSCGGITTAGAFDTETNTASVGGGLGGGEFYFQDNRPDTRNHSELTTGAIAQIPGFSQLAVTVVDPGSLFSQGVGWFQNADGTRNRSFEVIPDTQDTAGLGKANGLGDLEALCDQAPVEVGNYVWSDANGDGIQGPDETGIDGVNVLLTCGTDTQTAVTANGGYYAFTNAATVSNGATQASFMDYGENCSLSIDLSQEALTEFSITQTDADNQIDNNALTDLRDSDAILATDNLAEITFVSGLAGENNHTLDFGFTASCDCEADDVTKVGNRIWNDANGDGIQDYDEFGIDGVSVLLTCGTDTQEAITMIGGYYVFSNATTISGIATQALFMDFGEDCTLSVDLSQEALTGFSLTTANAEGQTDNNALTDLRDSDAIATDNDLVEITFVTGLAGENNHTLDFGFTGPCPCGINKPTDPIVPDDNDTTDPVVPDDNDTTDPVVPDDNDTTDPVVPDDNDTTDPVVPDDNDTTDPVVPDDNDTIDPVVPDDNDTTDPVVPDDNDTTTPDLPIPS